MEKTKIFAWVGSTVLVLSGCTTLEVTGNEANRCGTPPSIEQAQQAIQVYIERAGFKDPESAQIRDVRIMRRAKWYNGLVNGGGYTYGWEVDFQVNAKNGFGAYVGFEEREVLRESSGMVHWRLL
jgi:hypothetical protein